jgi:hypothetical protein
MEIKKLISDVCMLERVKALEANQDAETLRKNFNH